MKKFIFTFACILYSFLTFSQEFISYDFENLNDGNLNNQDNWQVMSSQSNVNNGNMCPPNLGTETPPIITNISGTGSYSSQKAISFTGIYIISLNYLDGYKQNLMMIKNF